VAEVTAAAQKAKQASPQVAPAQLPTQLAAYSLAQLKDACRAKKLPVAGTKAVLRGRLEAYETAGE
jgi:hypothetical protein